MSQVTIKKLTRATRQNLLQINALLLQLSSRRYQMTLKKLALATKNKNNHIVILCDRNDIIGTITLVTINQITGNKGYIEDLVVDEKYRGKKLGKKLVMNIIDQAKKMNLDSLELKSESYRIVANMLYKKLGFASKEANVYTMNFKNGKK